MIGLKWDCLSTKDLICRHLISYLLQNYTLANRNRLTSTPMMPTLFNQDVKTNRRGNNVSTNNKLITRVGTIMYVHL